MSKPPKSDPAGPALPSNGVAEEAVAYDTGSTADDWSIELARIEAYRRNGITHDAEPVLEAFLASVQARGEGQR